MGEPDWQLCRSFLAVLREGSLSAAARRLGQTQPTLGRQIAALEAALGQTLFTRSTDGLHPTDVALALAPHAETMAAAAAALLRAASGDEATLRGSVRLTASEFIGGAVLPPMLTLFRDLHPEVEIELSLSDRNEDLSRRDADLAVRNVAPTQAALVTRRIGEAPVKLFAHRRYAAAHGLPSSLAELERHAMLGHPDHAARARAILGFAPRFSFRCESALGLLAAVRAGVGIGYLQTGVASRNPDLVPVLPELVVARVGIWLAMHEGLRTTRRVRALFDHLGVELTRYVKVAS